MSTDSSSGSMRKIEKSALSEVEKPQQEIWYLLFETVFFHAATFVSVGTETWNIFSQFTFRKLSMTYILPSANCGPHFLNPSMAKRPFEYLLENRLAQLLQCLGCDLHRVCIIRKTLMFICNQRVSGIADSIGIQPLLNHIYSTGKKVVLMSRGKSKNSDRVYRSYFCFPVETEERNQVYAPLKIPIYIYGISESFDARNHGDIFEIVGQAFKVKDDQMLRAVMEDLSCKADDMVLMRNNVHDTESMTLDGILLVDIQTVGTRPPTLYSTHEMRYGVNSHTTLTRILAGDLDVL
ncbi:uncharacterized protein Bfra_012191 [Botrytis fragariae]|uniref:Uncharacterized protein n=1 Tax=Botrytis fragariae TaxID=1964551 RepID=A0A8H6EE32_9HELO|nr:uncharacterized protein Bfra_012191 [Botrytis fragariae]KAF5868545.1 hypothetical protein Bfra_012191 [Botrytis fragariae]